MVSLDESMQQGYQAGPNPKHKRAGLPRFIHLDEHDALGPLHLPRSPSTIILMLER